MRDHASNEAINSLLPHPDNFLLLHQHLALAALVPDTDVTHTAINSGPWSDPATWINGIVPGNAARVFIPAGVVVTVDGIHTTPLKTVRVDGTLRFDPSIDTELWVDTLVGKASGTFEMGTETQPVAADKTARLVIGSDGPIDRAWDPFAVSRGLVFSGVVSIFGAEKTPWLPLAMPPMAGHTTLQLASSPVGWAPGDKIVVAGTNATAHEDEVRQIISVNASTITIDALVFDHSVPRSDLQVHVANLDRNAVIESESRSLVERGHVMFHHDAVVHIGYAAFQDLGRTDKSRFVNNSAVDRNGVLAAGTGTNQVGRYPVHFHRQGIEDDGAPAMVRGTVVSGSPGWGFVNHSSNVVFEDNVACDVGGAGFVNEAGNEIGAYRNNIASECGVMDWVRILDEIFRTLATAASDFGFREPRVSKSRETSPQATMRTGSRSTTTASSKRICISDYKRTVPLMLERKPCSRPKTWSIPPSLKALSQSGSDLLRSQEFITTHLMRLGSVPNFGRRCLSIELQGKRVYTAILCYGTTLVALPPLTSTIRLCGILTLSGTRIIQAAWGCADPKTKSLRTSRTRT